MQKNVVFLIIIFIIIISGCNIKNNSHKIYEENLNLFYNITYNDPLFYSPHDSKDDINFSYLKKFNQELKGSIECNYSFPIMPEQFLEELSLNIMLTNNFISNKNQTNALKLLKQNKKTLLAYSSDYQKTINFLTNENLTMKCGTINMSKHSQNNLILNTPYGKSFQTKDIIEEIKSINENIRILQNEINLREKVLLGKSNYSELYLIKSNQIPNKQYSNNKTFLNETQAKKLMKIYLKTNNKTNNLETINLTKLYINSPCFIDENSIIYGTTNNSFYPNILTGSVINAYIQYNAIFQEFNNDLTPCNCIYAEDTRFQWSLVNYWNNYYKNKTNLTQIEKEFLRQPSIENLKRIKLENKKNQNNVNTWKEYQKQKSKIHIFNNYISNYYNKEHKEYWKNSHTELLNINQSEENKYLVIMTNYISFIPQTYMLWSDSIYKLERKEPTIFNTTQSQISDFNYFNSYYNKSNIYLMNNNGTLNFNTSLAQKDFQILLKNN